MWSIPVILSLLLAPLRPVEAKGHQNSCVIKSGGTNVTDDAPAILKAFRKCGQNGKIVFEPTTYYINSVMNISWLDNVDIDIRGTLLWSTDIPYWLNNSMDVGYQNQSTALIIGGNNVRINGYEKGTFDGNGDYWYQWIREQPNTSNYPGRPHGVTFDNLTNSVIRGLTFLRSQMWYVKDRILVSKGPWTLWSLLANGGPNLQRTMSIINSHNVLLDSILVNNTGNWAQSSNTDGADTIRSSHITFNNWTVYNGDDSLSMKANSTDISITNCKFYDGLGIAMGSIGQYNDQFETIERITVKNIEYDNTLHAFYIKTWTDDQNGYPPNGGGGGLGFASEMKLTNLTTTGLRGAAFAISQCTRFSGAPGQGNCTNSEFQIRNVEIDGLSGTSESTRLASLQCSAVAPCTNITIVDSTLHLDNGTAASEFLCGNVLNPTGFKCTGVPCVGGSATGEC